MFSWFQLRDITMDNASLLLQIDNTKLANDDFKNKWDMTCYQFIIKEDLEIYLTYLVVPSINKKKIGQKYTK